MPVTLSSRSGIWSGFVLLPAPSQSSGATTTAQPASGYKRAVSNPPSFSITVNNTNPTFFYCAQLTHCNLGMVFAINPSVTIFCQLYLTTRQIKVWLISKRQLPQRPSLCLARPLKGVFCLVLRLLRLHHLLRPHRLPNHLALLRTQQAL